MYFDEISIVNQVKKYMFDSGKKLTEMTIEKIRASGNFFGLGREAFL
jgi:hypothetical protein